MTIGFMFPGQGTQRRGMGRWIERASPAAAEVFDLGSAIVGRDLRHLCFHTPDAELASTDNAQIAVFTSNAAAAAALAERGVRPDVAVGHSIGEMNALCAAGAVRLADGFGLMRDRAALMAELPPSGAMAMVLGLAPSDVEALTDSVAQSVGPVVTAVINGPANVVVSGTREAVTRLGTEARRAGARAVIAVPVGAAFHSPLMAGLRGRWRNVVAAVEFDPPRCAIVLNTTGALTLDPTALRAAAVDQLTRPVRWLDAVRTIGGLVEPVRLIEAGAARLLGALVRAIDPRISTVSMAEPRAWDRVPAESVHRNGAP